jgi:hypothetical protein
MWHSEINDDSTKVIPHRATAYALRSDPRVLKEFSQAGVVIKPGEEWARLVRVAPHLGGSDVFTTLNDALGPVWRSSYGHPMLDYWGGDTDTSTYMAAFRRSVHYHLSFNMPLGDTDGKAHAVPNLLDGWGKL